MSAKPKNADIPKELAGERWLKVLIPTFIKHCCCHFDLWELSDSALINTLQKAINTVYGRNHGYKATIGDVVHKRVSLSSIHLPKTGD